LTVPDCGLEALANKASTTHETLVTLGVVVLETDLQLDGLDEVSLLSTSLFPSGLAGLGENSLDRGSHARRSELGHGAGVIGVEG
jgi:hypothetical protein